LQTRSLRKNADVVLARSTDGRFCPALAIDSVEGLTKVRFLQGGEAILKPSDQMPSSAIPGAKFQFEHPQYGWVAGRLSSHDRDARPATLEDWVVQTMVSLEKNRVEASSANRGAADRAAALASTAVAGALLQRLMTW
jgi:hypothetical protein